MNWRYFYLILLIIPLIAGCEEKSQYERLVETELAKNVRHDSLFMGYSLGMARQEFYDHSWALNRKELVMQGPQNQTVEYELDDNELPFDALMNFYPDFHDDSVFQMRVYFRYKGWAPWNRRLQSDSLQTDVVELFEDWYGDGFIRIEGESNKPEFVKVDGNRRIVVARKDEREVLAVFTDLLEEKELENQNNL